MLTLQQLFLAIPELWFSFNASKIGILLEYPVAKYQLSMVPNFKIWEMK